MASKQDNVSTHGLLLHCATTMKIQVSVLIKYKANNNIISSKISCSDHDIADKVGHVTLDNNHVVTIFVDMYVNEYERLFRITPRHKFK